MGNFFDKTLKRHILIYAIPYTMSR